MESAKSRSTAIQPARGDAMRELIRMQSGFGQLLDIWSRLSTLEDGLPLADIEETDDSYIIELDLPGVDKSDIHTDVAGQRLIVSGVRKEKERTGVLRRRSRSVGAFRHEIVLPGKIDADRVTAKFVDGVLTIEIAKASREKPRHIKIQ